MLRNSIFVFCIFAIGMAAAGEGWAAETMRPGANEKFISLEAARNLSAHKKPQLNVPQRFLPLTARNKFLPLRGRAQPVQAQAQPVSPVPVLPSAAGSPNRPQTASAKPAASNMTKEQAQQILSIFAMKD